MNLSGYAGLLEIIDQRHFMSKPAHSLKLIEKFQRRIWGAIEMRFYSNLWRTENRIGLNSTC